MTISAKSRNRACPVTEIKELTSFLETPQAMQSRQLLYIVVAKDKKAAKKDKETSKAGRGATRWERIGWASELAATFSDTLRQIP